MKYLLSILLASSFFACNGEKEKVVVVTSFPAMGTLQAQVRQQPISMLLPRYLGVVDDQLFVYKEREEKLFAFFRLPDCTFLGEGGTRGQGPEEFNTLDTRSFHPADEGFNVIESGSHLLKTVVYENGRLTVKQMQQMFDKGGSGNGFYPLTDSVYVTFGEVGGENEYSLFDKKANTLTATDVYPQWTDDTHKPGTPPKFVTYLKSCVVHPDGKKFAAFYGRFKRLRIYDHKVRLLHDVDVRTEPYAISFDASAENQPVYYIGQPYATDTHIYALCANSGIEEPDNPGKCELHVWTWDGEAVACYSFDRLISLMAISGKYQKILALDRSADDEIYVYDLPQIK